MQVIPPLCFLINHYLCFVYVDCKFLWQGLSLVRVCACACVYPGQKGLEPQSVEAVISNHLVIVFLDIIIKSIKLKLCLNSLLQKWKHVNCFWPCLQSSSIREMLLKGK